MISKTIPISGFSISLMPKFTSLNDEKLLPAHPPFTPFGSGDYCQKSAKFL
jgi:hypothetical protein